MLLSGPAKPFGPEAEAMLFVVARDDHVKCTILPALAAGKWVICDRFADPARLSEVIGEADPRRTSSRRSSENFQQVIFIPISPSFSICPSHWDWSGRRGGAIGPRSSMVSKRRKSIFTKD